ncbi:MAG: hypothetical protein AAF708_16040 [Deinococcota bacterium]
MPQPSYIQRLQLTMILSLSLLTLSAAFAQRLPSLLSADSIVVLGMQDMTGAGERSAAFQEEFNRLELATTLASLFGDDVSEDDLENALPEGVTWLDVLGTEAWLSVSASSFNPFPVITLATVVSPSAADALAPLLPDDDADVLQEGDYTFYTLFLEDPDAPVQRIAYGLADDVLFLSSNPDTLRASLRQLGGSDEASLLETDGYNATLGTLAGGNFYGYVNYAGVAQAIKPFATGFGFDALVERVSSMLGTLNTSAGVVRLLSDNVVSESVTSLNEAAGDTSLYNLLTIDGYADTSTATRSPAGALSYSTSFVDVAGWWDYLNELSSSVPELGGSLNDLVLSFTGVDLSTNLFGWMGTQVVSIVTGAGEVTEPGMMSDNLLGEFVYMIGTNDTQAASSGLAQVMQTISTTVAMFADPMGGSGDASSSTTDIAGVTVSTYAMAPGVTISTAVLDGYALISPSLESISTVLNAGSANLASLEAYQDAVSIIPGDASAVTYTDTSTNLRASAEQLASQLQVFAGLGGASTLDFDAIQTASDNLMTFFEFAAERLGPTVGYSQRSGADVYSYAETPVSW